ncbi:MAG TPA: divergent polysaccharide deacetylase family protein [Bacillota bacterium]
MRTHSSGRWLEIGLIYLSFLVLAFFTTMSLQYKSESNRKEGRKESAPVIDDKQQLEDSVLDAQTQIEEIINLLAEQNGWEPRESPVPFIAGKGSDHDRPGAGERSFSVPSTLTLEELRDQAGQIQACLDRHQLGVAINKLSWLHMGFKPVMQVEIGVPQETGVLFRVNFFPQEKEEKREAGVSASVAFTKSNPDLLKNKPQTQPKLLYPAPKMETFPELKPMRRPAQPRVALIIDDVGFVDQPTLDFFTIPYPLTFAVLPGGEFSLSHAAQALDKGYEVILHLPLEPLDTTVDYGPGGITSRMTASEALQQLRKNLEAIPGVRGVNNHMGSKATQDQVLLGLIMSELKTRDLFFVDSRTVATSVAQEVAVQYGVPSAERDVFIDYYGVEGIESQMEILLKKALTNGTAVGIAHTRPGVAQAIAKCLPWFIQAGVEIVPVSSLVNLDGQPGVE